jgi:alkylated DNA repair dioxygenase AlkB
VAADLGWHTCTVLAMGSLAELVNGPPRSGSSVILYQPDFIAPDHAAALFKALHAEVPWEVKADDYGVQNRETHYMADPGCSFSYVGLDNPPQPWHPGVAELRDRLNAEVCPQIAALVNATHVAVTGCLLNRYRSGEQGIEWHSDEVKDHGDARLVATVSLGGERPVEFRRGCGTAQCGPAGGPSVRQSMRPGSLLIMAGDTQEHWQHRVPAVDEAGVECRISLTFRSMVNELKQSSL